MKNSVRNTFLWTAITLSALLSIIYTARGIYLLGCTHSPPVDLWLRWCDLRYVSERQNPYDVGEIYYHVPRVSPFNKHPARAVHIDPDLDRSCGGGGYPPWAFFWSYIFIPPVSWNWSRLWFFVTNIACLVFLARFAWRAAPSAGLAGRLFLLSGAMGVNAIGTTLGNGQWGLILMVVLLLAVLYQDKLRGVPAGFLYAIALLKPTFAFTYAVIFLLRLRILLLAVAGFLTLLAAFVIGLRVNTNPLEMLLQSFAQTSVWRHVPASIQDFLPVFGFSNTVNVLASLGLSLAATLIILYKRPADLLVQMSVCMTLARIGPYHQLYDNIMVIFLLLGVGRLFLVRPALSHALVYVAIAITLYLPGRLSMIPGLNLLYLCIWSCGLGWLVYHHGSDSPAAGIAPANALVTQSTP